MSTLLEFPETWRNLIARQENGGAAVHEWRTGSLSHSRHERATSGSLISLLHKMTGRQQCKQIPFLVWLATGHFPLIIQWIPTDTNQTLIFLSNCCFLSVYFSPWQFHLTNSQFVVSLLSFVSLLLHLNFHLYSSTVPVILDIFSLPALQRLQRLVDLTYSDFVNFFHLFWVCSSEHCCCQHKWPAWPLLALAGSHRSLLAM